MFKYQDLGPTGVPSYVGYGLGGLKGLKGLPDRICNMVSLEICAQESCSMPFFSTAISKGVGKKKEAWLVGVLKVILTRLMSLARRVRRSWCTG